MRARLLAPLLLLAACDRETVTQEATIEIERVDSVIVTMSAGALVVEPGPAGAVAITARSRKPVKLDDLVRSAGRGVVMVTTGDAAIQTLTIKVPTGVDVTASVAVHITLRGSLNNVKAVSAGGIDADVAVIGGGELRSTGGDVRLVARRPPTGDLTCRSTVGDVSVTMPSSFRGRAHVSTKTGKCDVPADSRMRATWGPDRRTVLLFAGPAMTAKERKEELDAERSPRAIWVDATQGTASFRLAEE